MSERVLVLIDMGSIFWRHWHATKEDPTKTHELTLEFIERLEAGPDNDVVICLDSPKSRRKERYPEYKANRSPKPAEAIQCLNDLADRLSSADWNVAVIKADGYEADDMIYTCVLQAELGQRVWICSQDKDMHGLVTEDDVWMLDYSGLFKRPHDIRKKWGVEPYQMPDLLALMGDASDNIPGCPMVGAGKAAMLLRNYGSIDGIKAASRTHLRSMKGFGDKVVDSLEAWDPSLATDLVRLEEVPGIRLDELLSGATDGTEEDDIPFK